jgi:hypothetical protein
MYGRSRLRKNLYILVTSRIEKISFIYLILIINHYFFLYNKKIKIYHICYDLYFILFFHIF